MSTGVSLSPNETSPTSTITTTTTTTRTTIFEGTLSNLPPPSDGSIRGLEVDSSVAVIAVQSVTLMIIIILGFLGNLMVILVIQRSRRVQSTTNVFVNSLACSDLILTLLVMPFVCARVIAQEWPSRHLTCRMVHFLQFSALGSTSFVLLAICVDRFYTILYPLSFKITRGTAKRMVLTAWVGSTMLSSLSVHFFETTTARDLSSRQDRVEHACPTYIPSLHWSGTVYTVVCTLTHYGIPAAMLCLGYGRICWHIRSIRHRARHCRLPHEQLSVVPRNKVKIVRMLMTASFFTITLYCPFFAAQLVYCTNPRTFISADVFVATFWLVGVSALVKPVVYAVQNPIFWRGCKEVLCMSAMRCYRLNTYAVTSASGISKRNYVGVMEMSRDQISERIEFPLNAFNRRKYEEKTKWPINGSYPTTSF